MTTANLTKVIVPCRLSYAHLWEPDSINGSEPKYSVSCIIDKEDKETIAKIKKARRGRVGKGCSQTLDCSGQMGTLMRGGRIRRLTPRECFRLQGFSDELFDRASAVNSDAQLYKQAGNAVTATVAYAVAMSLPESRS